MSEHNKIRAGVSLIFIGLILGMNEGVTFPLVNFVGVGIAGVGALILNW